MSATGPSKAYTSKRYPTFNAITNKKSVVKTAITIAIVGGLLLIVLSLVKCANSFYRVLDEFPEQANVEHLRSRIPQVVQEVDAAIASTESGQSLVAALEKISYPEEILFVAIQYENNEDDSEDREARLHIVNRLPGRNTSGANSNLKIVANGGGYGHTNEQHYWVLQQSLNKYNYEYLEIYIKREPPQTPEN